MSSLREGFDRAEAALLAMGDVGSLYNSVEVYQNGDARVCVFPSKERAAASIQALLRFAGKITKDQHQNVQATKDGITVILFTVLVCEKVGTKTVERPIMKATGEMETIEQPVYKCRLPFEEAGVE